MIGLTWKGRCTDVKWDGKALTNCTNEELVEAYDTTMDNHKTAAGVFAPLVLVYKHLANRLICERVKGGRPWPEGLPLHLPADGGGGNMGDVFGDMP